MLNEVKHLAIEPRTSSFSASPPPGADAATPSSQVLQSKANRL
jgi:hypothetical protein